MVLILKRKVTVEPKMCSILRETSILMPELQWNCSMEKNYKEWSYSVRMAIGGAKRLGGH